MWKKDSYSDQSAAGAKSPPESNAPPSPGPSGAIRPSSSPRTAKGAASILSADMICNGKISGKSDIVISGNFEGSIELPNNTVTVELSGTVNASTIVAKTIVVIGTVEGSLKGKELVQVMSSGNVLGDIKSERVVLDNGCKFNGTIETIVKAKDKEGAVKPPPSSSPQPRNMQPGSKPNAPAPSKAGTSPTSKLA